MIQRLDDWYYRWLLFVEKATGRGMSLLDALSYRFRRRKRRHPTNGGIAL